MTRKSTKKTAAKKTAPVPTSDARMPTPAEQLAAAEEAIKNFTPEQMGQTLLKVVGDNARLESKLSFLTTHIGEMKANYDQQLENLVKSINNKFDDVDDSIGQICHHGHIELVKRPKIFDAKVELFTEQQVPATSMTILKSSNPHPTLGAYQVVVTGEDGSIQSPAFAALDPIVQKRIDEAFADKGIRLNKHYFAVLSLVTSETLAQTTPEAPQPDVTAVPAAAAKKAKGKGRGR